MAKPAKQSKDEPIDPLHMLVRQAESLAEDLVDAVVGEKERTPSEDAEKPKPPDPQASLETIGLTDCSVCGREVSVMLTKTHHPFTACGRCGARTFYNSQVAIHILKRHLRKIQSD